MANTLPTANESISFEIIIAIVIAFITLLVFIFYKRSKSTRNGILLMGLSDSGKTLIYSQLLHSKFVNTYTSTKENVSEYNIDEKSFRLIDIPGHERLRGKYFDQYKPSARGIVYVIDSLTLQKQVRDVAEFLYTILSDVTISSITPNILILCNKQDEMLSKASNVIKSVLEKEMNTLRITKSSQLQAVDSSKNTNVFLGKKDKDFEFSSLSSFNVEFGESQVKDKANLEQLKSWILKL